MARDRIQPLKLESADSGGVENDAFPTAVNRNEDYVDCKGVTLQSTTSNDEAVYVERDTNDKMVFKDSSVAAPKLLEDLYKGGFGGDYQSAESAGESATTSSTYQDKVTLVSNVLTGTYLILFEVDRKTASANKRVFTRLYNVTNSAVLCFSDFRPTLADVWDRDVGFGYVTFAGASKTFKVQYASQDNSTSVTVKEARIALWRIG
jgi:hypothetical protein